MTSPASVSTLPPLGVEERAHSARVAAHIREFVAAQGGVIGFDAYMRLALYSPGLGYYSAGAAKLGGSGRFRDGARGVEPVLALPRAPGRRDPAGDRRDILELGAGLAPWRPTSCWNSRRWNACPGVIASSK
jgi:hypothetical protein